MIKNFKYGIKLYPMSKLELPNSKKRYNLQIISPMHELISLNLCRKKKHNLLDPLMRIISNSKYSYSL